MTRDPEYALLMEKVKAILAGLPEDDLAELKDHLDDILPSDDEVAAIHDQAAREVRRVTGGTDGRGHVTRRQEYVRCGRDNCRCSGDEEARHGPYWYEYWREDGRLRKRYAGKVS